MAQENFADSARALRARGASTAEQQLADGMLHRLSNDAGGPSGKNFRGPIFFCRKRASSEQEAPARQSNNLHGKAQRLRCTGSAVTWRGKLSGPEKLFSARIHHEQGASMTEQQLAWKGAKALLHRRSSDIEGEHFGGPKSCFLDPPQARRQHDRATCCFPSPRNETGEVPKQNFRGSKSCFPNAGFFVQAGQRAVRGTLQKVCTSNPTVKQQLSEPEKVVH